jgi:hypothetical protein
MNSDTGGKSALSDGLGPTAQVQACRPEDRAMLATPAGAELVACAAAALDDEPQDLIVRLLCAARDLGVAEDLRLLLGEAAAEVDRLGTLAAVRDWAATSASVHLGGVIEEAQTVLRAIHDEAERVDLPSGSLTLLTGEMKTRLADALLLDLGPNAANNRRAASG